MTPELDRIVADVRRRAAVRRGKQPIERLKDIVREDSWRRERFLSAILRDPFAIVPAIRRRTPWSGILLEEPAGRSASPTRLPAPGPRWFTFVQACQKGGAAALAVATELDHFGGTLEDLRAVEFTGLSRIHDDYVVDAAMLYEACLYGADAVVLRASVAGDVELDLLRALAQELGLAVLLAAGSERELERAVALEPEVVLVVARDESTGEVDPRRVADLAARVPPGARIAAAGGLCDRDDLARARDAGATIALVGEALLRSEDAQGLLESWRASLAAPQSS